jgi:hypothetical protein
VGEDEEKRTENFTPKNYRYLREREREREEEIKFL